MELIALILAFVGLYLVIDGVRGRPVLSTPRCPKCRFDLRRTDGVHERCPECGLDLDGGRRAHFARRRWGWKTITLGVVILAVGPPGAYFVGLSLHRATMQGQMLRGGGPSPMALRAMNSEQIVAALATSWDAPWTWQELETRRADGRLSDEQIRAAVTGLAAALEASPPAGGLNWGQQEIEAWRIVGIIDDPLFDRLRVAAAQLHLDLDTTRVRPGQPVTVSVNAMRSSLQFGSQSVLTAVERVLDAAGNELPVVAGEGEARRRARSPGRSSRTVRADLEPGPHELTVEVVVGLLDPVQAAGLTPFDFPALESWPENVTRRTRTHTVTVTVVAPDQPLVETTVDPAQRDAVRAALEPMGVSAAGVRGGQVRVRVVRAGSRPRSALAVPVVMSIHVEAGEKSWDAGALGFSGGSSFSRGGQFTAADFDSSIETVDVIFRVDPEAAAANGYGELGPIWGEDVRFENVKVTWFE